MHIRVWDGYDGTHLVLAMTWLVKKVLHNAS
jgi:hypothetical protein